MNYQTEDLAAGIRKLASEVGDVTIMEVCGTHTQNIRRFGIPSLLPGNIRLVSGPGCPVCVTSQEDIAAAVFAAGRENVIFVCFGDMMRVPCRAGSLEKLRQAGRDVRLATSPLDALKIAKENPRKEIVYFGIGFETTAPHTAALVEAAERTGTGNLSILNVHKTMPEAIRYLLRGENQISALLCPGHVASVTGSDAFSFVASELQRPAAVSGFEAFEILAAILKLLDMIRKKDPQCVNMYPQAVTREGNRQAQELMDKIFKPCDAVWRGIGCIPGSGLAFRECYAGYDAKKRFDIPHQETEEPEKCLCAKILKGEKNPEDCVFFGKECTPDNPVGPCMVSSEGSCAACYRYRP